MDFIPIGFLSFNKYLLPLPACRSSPSFKLLLLLLLAGDVNVNPGPTIGLVNARSVRNKVPAIEELISSNKLLCLGLTETWLMASETSFFLSDLTPDGFDFLHKPRSGRGGGVGFIAHKDLFPSVVEFPSFNTLEVLGCRVRFGKKFINIVTVYRPPDSFDTKCLVEIQHLFKIVNSLTSESIIMGDFNIHVDNPNSKHIDFLAALDCFNLEQHVKDITHTRHILDLFITSADCNFVSNVGHLLLKGSLIILLFLQI